MIVSTCLVWCRNKVNAQVLQICYFGTQKSICMQHMLQPCVSAHCTGIPEVQPSVEDPRRLLLFTDAPIVMRTNIGLSFAFSSAEHCPAGSIQIHQRPRGFWSASAQQLLWWLQKAPAEYFSACCNRSHQDACMILYSALSCKSEYLVSTSTS